jgi:hypothetical protein
MSSHKRRSVALSFVDRYGLWSEAQARAAAAMDKAIVQKNFELLRFSFPDQHGVLRGKTLVASEASHALRNGVTMTSTLFAKDTAHRTVFPVFDSGAGIGVAEMSGAGNFIMWPIRGPFAHCHGPTIRAGFCVIVILPTAGRCRSPRDNFIATRSASWRSSVSIMSLASRLNFTCLR